jgi:hypothetical protein
MDTEVVSPVVMMYKLSSYMLIMSMHHYYSSSPSSSVASCVDLVNLCILQNWISLVRVAKYLCCKFAVNFDSVPIDYYKDIVIQIRHNVVSNHDK